MHIYDPKVTHQDFVREMKRIGVPSTETIAWESNIYEAVKNAHAICLLTEWDVFKTYDYNQIFQAMMKPAFVFDARNILNH